MLSYKISPEFTWSCWAYSVGQKIMLVIYLIIGIPFVVNVVLEKQLNKIFDDGKLGLLTALLVTGIARQPLVWIGLKRMKMKLIIISAFIEVLAHITFIFFTVYMANHMAHTNPNLKHDDGNNFVVTLFLVHILAGYMSLKQLQGIEDGMNKIQYQSTLNRIT